MRILEYLRKQAFWAKDSITGKSVSNALSLLRHYNSPFISATELDSYYRNVLSSLLNYAAKHTAFYSPYLGKEIYEFPVVNKTLIKSQQDDFLSKEFQLSDLIVMSTSGSTGTPFRCYQDITKKRHVNAEVIYYNGLIGYEIGRKIIYFRSIVSEVAKSKFQQFTQNIHLIDCASLSDDIISQRLSEIELLTKHNAGMILSYASTLSAFQRYFERHGIEQAKRCKIYGIVSGSEMLQDKTRNVLEGAFGCKCVSRYANEENGFLGQDDTINNVFIPNYAHYYFEILKLDSDSPASEGEVGRIVITDLYNHAMPMIRYDSGDVGTWKFVEKDEYQIRAIGSFGGRRVDMIYDCEGNIVSPHAITNLMWEFQEITQYQFIQINTNHYRMRLNISSNSFNQSELHKSLMKVLGQQSVIEFEMCDEIPVLASGKRRYIVNQMHG